MPYQHILVYSANSQSISFSSNGNYSFPLMETVSLAVVILNLCIYIKKCLYVFILFISIFTELNNVEHLFCIYIIF